MHWVRKTLAIRIFDHFVNSKVTGNEHINDIAYQQKIYLTIE